ncbi:MAG TPA: hypothetical protein VMM76_13565, partial [Pirellulaceae bacterium]|nr:hypothetical protein [Pirellulaceae bacterium]
MQLGWSELEHRPPNTSPQRKQVNPRVAIFKQVGTRAFGTAFTRWRVGLVLSMIDSMGIIR